jgi:stalled ribosome rescue protein Dom34
MTYAQTSLSSMQKKGDEAFEKSDFRSAVDYYKQGGVQNGANKKTRLRLAISEYEVNDVDGALRILK